MNILVIGNGFDLAHGLPTSYQDFLKFTESFRYYDQNWPDVNGSESENEYLTNIFEAQYADEHAYISDTKKITQKLKEELKDCVENNVWLEYFLLIYKDRERNGKNGWIDFESEISEVIQSLDDDMNLSISQYVTSESKIQHITNPGT